MMASGPPARYREVHDCRQDARLVARDNGPKVLVVINLYVPQPLLPELKAAYEVSTLGVSLLMSVATLSLALALLIFGPLSDAIGREGIMRITLLLAGGLSLALAFAPNFESLLLLRLMQGFVLGGLPAVAIAWMGDAFEKPALLSAVGLYIGANSLGGISGRVVGGAAAGIGGGCLHRRRDDNTGGLRTVLAFAARQPHFRASAVSTAPRA